MQSYNKKSARGNFKLPKNPKSRTKTKKTRIKSKIDIDNETFCEWDTSFTTFRPLSTSSNLDLKTESLSTLDLSLTSEWSLASHERHQAFIEYMKNISTRFETPTFETRLEKLKWLQQQRNIGVYVNCDNCNCLRYLDNVKDPTDLPEMWYCFNNTDKTQNSCGVRGIVLKPYQLEQIIDNKYNSGSIVWAKVNGYPWFPGMVDDDPDTETFYYMEDEHSDTPTEYNVTFFGKKVSRAWCKVNNLKAFKNDPYRTIEWKFRRSKRSIEEARKDALNALKMSLLERLKRYSFISRWNKPIC